MCVDQQPKRRAVTFPCRERNDGLYTPMAYLLFKVFEECLLALGTSLLLSSAVFFLVGLHGNWLLFWGTYWMTTCTGIGNYWLPDPSHRVRYTFSEHAQLFKHGPVG